MQGKTSLCDHFEAENMIRTATVGEHMSGRKEHVEAGAIFRRLGKT
jgi:hypothetical protein